jgi:hypothetical protein
MNQKKYCIIPVGEVTCPKKLSWIHNNARQPTKKVKARRVLTSPEKKKNSPTGNIQLTCGTSLAKSIATKPAVTKLQNGCHVCLFFSQVIPIGGTAATHLYKLVLVQQCHIVRLGITSCR